MIWWYIQIITSCKNVHTWATDSNTMYIGHTLGNLVFTKGNSIWGFNSYHEHPVIHNVPWQLVISVSKFSRPYICKIVLITFVYIIFEYTRTRIYTIGSCTDGIRRWGLGVSGRGRVLMNKRRTCWYYLPRWTMSAPGLTLTAVFTWS